MQTIIYQGQPIEANLVNYLSGTIPTSTVDADGDEELFRDEAGRYYLRRELNWLGIDDDSGAGERRASGRVLTHRINVNAAILWATTRINSETLDLRSDAASLLMENRGYADPFPLHLNAAKRSGQPATTTALVCVVDGPVSGATADGWFDGCIQPEEGSGARVRTIFDLDPLHAALLKKFTDDHGINVAVLVRACLMQQLQFTYNGQDREEEGAAVECLRQYGQLGSGPDEREHEHMCARVGMAAPKLHLVESEVAA